MLTFSMFSAFFFSRSSRISQIKFCSSIMFRILKSTDFVPVVTLHKSCKRLKPAKYFCRTALKLDFIIITELLLLVFHQNKISHFVADNNKTQPKFERVNF